MNWWKSNWWAANWWASAWYRGQVVVDTGEAIPIPVFVKDYRDDEAQAILTVLAISEDMDDLDYIYASAGR